MVMLKLELTLLLLLGIVLRNGGVLNVGFIQHFILFYPWGKGEARSGKGVLLPRGEVNK